MVTIKPEIVFLLHEERCVFFYEVVNFKACTVIISVFAIQECQNPLAPFFTYCKYQLIAHPQLPVSKST